MALTTTLLALALQGAAAHPGGLTSLAERPDSRVIASAGWDNAIRVWKMPEGTLLRTHRGHTDHITGLAYSGDGKILVSSSGDGTIRVWDGEGTRALGSIRGGTSFLSGVGISPDGRTIYASGYDNRVKSWRWPSPGSPMVHIQMPSDAYDMALSSDGLYVAAVGPDAGIRGAATRTRNAVPPNDFEGQATRVKFQRGGHWVVASTMGEQVLGWNLLDGKTFNVSVPGRGQDADFVGNTHLAVVTYDRQLILIEREEYRIESRLTIPGTDGLDTVLISRDQKHAFIGDYQGRLFRAALGDAWGQIVEIKP